MKKIRLLLEFHCFPVWFYDENDEIIENEINRFKAQIESNVLQQLKLN